MSDLSEKELLEIIAAKALIDTAKQLRTEDLAINASDLSHRVHSLDHYLQKANNELWQAKQALK